MSGWAFLGSVVGSCRPALVRLRLGGRLCGRASESDHPSLPMTRWSSKFVAGGPEDIPVGVLRATQGFPQGRKHLRPNVCRGASLICLVAAWDARYSYTCTCALTLPRSRTRACTVARYLAERTRRISWFRVRRQGFRRSIPRWPPRQRNRRGRSPQYPRGFRTDHRQVGYF